MSQHGWAADPTKGTRESGERYLDLVVSRLAHFLEQFAASDPVPANFAFKFAEQVSAPR